MVDPVSQERRGGHLADWLAESADALEQCSQHRVDDESIPQKMIQYNQMSLAMSACSSVSLPTSLFKCYSTLSRSPLGQEYISWDR